MNSKLTLCSNCGGLGHTINLESGKQYLCEYCNDHVIGEDRYIGVHPFYHDNNRQGKEKQMNYIDILIQELSELHSLKGKFTIRTNKKGAIYLPLTSDIVLYANPDRDIEDTLSIEFVENNGKLLDWYTIDYEWSGCVSEDIQAWKNMVFNAITKFIIARSVSKIPFLQGGALA